jgi:membrane peptidoglycan carboxypeptidase
VSNDQPPPPGGPTPSRPSRAGARKATGPKPTGPKPAKGQGSGRKGKVRLRDLSARGDRVKHVAKKTLKWGSITFLVLILLSAAGVYAVYRSIDIPDPNEDFEAQTSTVYYSDGKHVLGQFALQNRESIPLSEMPQSIQNAVISAEDRSFETNSGIDFKGIIRAAWTNLRSDSVAQGASTITQQYVKVLYLTQEQTWKRKIKEAFLAAKLSNELSKDEILEGYLNTIYFGRGAYGIQAASQAYFDKDAKDLTVPESAVLASVLNSPSALDPEGGKDAREALLARYQYVLDGMVSMGNLDEAQAAKFRDHLPKFPKVKEINKYGGQKGYLMTLVENQLKAEGFTDEEIKGGGLKVVTTFDWNKERDANQTIKAIRPKDRPQLHIALASVEPGTGAVRALIGGKNYLQSQINWATTGGQPGSSFKPFALAAGLEDGFTLTSSFDGNSPYTYPNGETVRNEGESFGVPSGLSYGTVSLTTATADSINTAYADLTVQMGDNGPQKVIDAAAKAGIPRDAPGLEANLGVALGSATISPLDMANAYGTFAAEGEHSDWYIIEKVSDQNGLRYQHREKQDQAFSKAIASNVTYALEQVVQTGTGTNALALGRPAAGKTGTATAVQKDGTQHVSSSWFVGYTPQLSTAVMYVRGQGNEPLDDGYLDPFFGGTFPTQTWAAYMKKALEGEPVKDFPDPAELHGESPTYVPPPTTEAPTTEAPTTEEPTTEKPTTEKPTTEEPTTEEPTTEEPTTEEPTTGGPPTTGGGGGGGRTPGAPTDRGSSDDRPVGLLPGQRFEQRQRRRRPAA